MSEILLDRVCLYDNMQSEPRIIFKFHVFMSHVLYVAKGCSAKNYDILYKNLHKQTRLDLNIFVVATKHALIDITKHNNGLN